MCFFKSSIYFGRLLIWLYTGWRLSHYLSHIEIWNFSDNTFLTPFRSLHWIQTSNPRNLSIQSPLFKYYHHLVPLCFQFPFLFLIFWFYSHQNLTSLWPSTILAFASSYSSKQRSICFIWIRLHNLEKLRVSNLK